MMRIVTSELLNRIYLAQMLKDGMMMSDRRRDVTDEAIHAVLTHFEKRFKSEGLQEISFKCPSGNNIKLMYLDKKKIAEQMQGEEHEDQKR